MNPFKFSLQKLLDLKKSQLDILKIDILKVSNEVSNLKAEISKIGNEIKISQNTMEEKMNAISEFRQWMNYVQSLYEKRKTLIMEVGKAEDKLMKLRNDYISLYREKKALENLKSLQKSQHDLEQLKESQNVIDEFGIQRKGT